MLDVEKFLVALRSNKNLDGKLKPIHLADTVQEEIKIIQAAVENSRRKWVTKFFAQPPTKSDVPRLIHVFFSFSLASAHKAPRAK